jgi:hypothetical protein
VSIRLARHNQSAANIHRLAEAKIDPVDLSTEWPFGSSLWICGDFYPEDVGIGVDFFRKTCFYGEGSYTFVGGV